MASNTDLLRQVRRIVAENPERHDQDVWYGNAFDDEVEEARDQLVEDVRQWALRPIPKSPLSVEATCGTTGCVAGWGAILHAPKGSRLQQGARVVLPNGEWDSIHRYAQNAFGLTASQASELFSPSLSREEVLEELDYLIENPDDDRPRWEREGDELDSAW